jgi:hypothetical protein
VRRFAIYAAAALVTAAMLTLALLLGSWGFNYRRYKQHETRLARLVELRPELERVEAGLEAEGSPLVAAPRDARELDALIERYHGQKREEIRDKASRFLETRVFAAGDMVYFLFFDERQRLRAFTCVSQVPQ